MPVTTDTHCVTRWSKLITSWEGVSLETLLEGVKTSAAYTVAHSYGGYTTNLPLANLRSGQACRNAFVPGLVIRCAGCGSRCCGSSKAAVAPGWICAVSSVCSLN